MENQEKKLKERYQKLFIWKTNRQTDKLSSLLINQIKEKKRVKIYKTENENWDSTTDVVKLKLY